MDRALTAKEAAEILHVTDEHLYRLCKKGLVPCVKLGRSWRFTQALLEKFLAGEWQPQKPKPKRGRPRKDYSNALAEVMGQDTRIIH